MVSSAAPLQTAGALDLQPHYEGQLKPINGSTTLSTGKVLASVYWEDPRNGQVLRQRHTNADHINKQGRRIYYLVYRHKNGDLFDLPLNDADDGGATTVSRQENSPSGPRDLYQGKGCTLATRKDVEEMFKRRAENRAEDQERKKLRDPKQAQVELAKIQADAMSKSLREVMNERRK